MSGLVAAVRAVLDDAISAYGHGAVADPLRQARTQLDGPLRVAFAGRLKAGKSTLLNAIVGEPLAATDATECTRVVTWYVDGPATRAWAHPRDGAPVQVRFRRTGRSTHIDLGGLDPTDLERLVVEIPNARLRRLTLVDTPGLGSSSLQVSDQTRALLVDDGPGVDAVVYLMRHVHTTDVGFLQSFHDDAFVATAPVNAIGVLSRADEVSGGQANALDVAATIADRYAADGRVRALVQTVVPVSGLLALAALGLSELQFGRLESLVAAGPSALVSVDRLRRADMPISHDDRAELLDTFGLFGLRHSVALLRAGRATNATSLATILAEECGVAGLRALLVERFTNRAGLLKAESTLRVVEAVLDAHPTADVAKLRQRVDAVVAGAHELTELRTITALRTGALDLDDPAQLPEVERLLGGEGSSAAARLGLPDGTPPDDLRAALVGTATRWQRQAQNPFAGGGVRRIAGVVRRTCEGLL